VFVVTTDSLGEKTELGVGASDLADGIGEGSSPRGAVPKERGNVRYRCASIMERQKEDE
jgi:hypothetical protein